MLLLILGPAGMASLFGLLIASIAVANEVSWRRRLSSGHKLSGRVVGNESQFDTVHPRIEFQWNTETIEFVSKFDHVTPLMDTDVVVVYDPESGHAELHSRFTRWYWTLFPGSLGLAFIVVGILGAFGNAG